MRRAVIEAGRVVNVIEAPADFTLPGVEIVDAEDPAAAIGAAWDGSTFTAPPEALADVSPASVSLAQFRAAVEEAGRTRDVINAIGGNLRAENSWNYAASIGRGGALVVALIGGPFTEAEIDQIFRDAARVPD